MRQFFKQLELVVILSERRDGRGRVTNGEFEPSMYLHPKRTKDQRKPRKLTGGRS